MTWVIAGFATAGALIDDNPIEGALKGAALAYGGGQLLAAGGATQAGTTAATAAGTAVPTAATGAGATSTGLLAPTTASSATAAAAEQAATAATTTNASMLADPFGVDATLMQNPVSGLATPSTATSVNPGTSLTQQGFESNLLQNNPNVSTTPGFKEKLQMGLLQQAPSFLPKEKPAPAPASSGPSLRVPPTAGPENLYLRFNRRKR
jgi:hypothetical protein